MTGPTDASLASADTDALRAEMIDRIVTYRRETIGLGPVSTRVLDAMRSVPRHLFVPDASTVAAYAEDTVPIKRGPDGAVLSCASAPAIVAMMLDQLQVQPGDRLLAIGAGTGYNAALLAELTGPTGQVTTVDVDPEVTAQARRGLAATGHHQVRVVTASRQAGTTAGNLYDRLIASVGSWDIPPAWWQQVPVGAAW